MDNSRVNRPHRRLQGEFKRPLQHLEKGNCARNQSEAARAAVPRHPRTNRRRVQHGAATQAGAAALAVSCIEPSTAFTIE
jgi:hypothetical protein